MIGVKSPFGARENFNGRIKGVGNEKEEGDVTYTLQWRDMKRYVTTQLLGRVRPTDLKSGRVRGYRSTRPNQ